MMELVYSSPSFQTFRFDFMFYPRSKAEAEQVQNIIGELKFHQAPEALPSTYGYFMVPPSEFDISFYYNGQINPNIPPISTCVLTNVNVNYAPNVFSKKSDSEVFFLNSLNACSYVLELPINKAPAPAKARGQ